MRFNHLVKEWAWRVNNGMPDPKKRTHLQILEDVLRGYKYSEEFIQEYILQIEEFGSMTKDLKNILEK